MPPRAEFAFVGGKSEVPFYPDDPLPPILNEDASFHILTKNSTTFMFENVRNYLIIALNDNITLIVDQDCLLKYYYNVNL